MQEPTLIKKTLSTTPKLNSLISKSVDFLLTPYFSTSSVFYATYHVDIFGPPLSSQHNLWIPLSINKYHFGNTSNWIPLVPTVLPKKR